MCIENLLPISIPSQLGTTTLFAMAFYWTGYISRKLSSTVEVALWKGILLLLIPAVVAMFFQWSMSSAEENWVILPYYLTAIAGTLGLISVSALIAQHSCRLTGVITFIGQRTLYILTFHFLGFKLVSMAYIWFTDSSIQRLSEFPVLEHVPGWLMLCYVAVAVAFSLVMHRAFHRIL
jgi:fucose 4-O-acetylase-like acetyltransferase